VAIAYPCDASSLGAAIEAAREGLIVPLLVGPEARMRAVAKAHGLDLSACECLDTPDAPKAAAVKAASL
jgi:phosphate acetyltransferase